MIINERVEVHSYNFAGVTLIAKRYPGRIKAVWVLICETCGQQLQVRKLGSEYWVSKCKDCKVEYTVTPTEVYRATENNLKRVM